MIIVEDHSDHSACIGGRCKHRTIAEIAKEAKAIAIIEGEYKPLTHDDVSEIMRECGFTAEEMQEYVKIWNEP